MSNFTVRSLPLRIQLALRRLDAVAVIAGLLCATGLAAFFWGVSGMRAEVAERQRVLTLLQQKFDAPHEPAVKAVHVSAKERLAHFYDALGEKDYAEQQVKTLFSVAEKNGLRLDQAEYKWSYDKDGRFYAYQVNLPLRGSYAPIRSFCEQVLLAIPFISLDEVAFKRDGVSNSSLEAKLRFTLYFADPALSPKRNASVEAER